MSESGKRYYWLKLPEDFFGQKEIKHLRKIAGGDTFTIIYLKMLLKSLSEDGKLYFEGYGEDFAKELALDIDEDAENVAITVNFLISKNILREVSVSEYEVLTAKEMVGSETDIARRVRKHRAAMAVLESASPKMLHCNSGETKCNTEIDIEKEIETEKDKDTYSVNSSQISDIVSYLNDKAGTHYRPSSDATKRHIHARLSEGYTLDDFYKVIDNKCGEWLGTDMAKFLRPETLFGSKFESYLNTPSKKQEKKGREIIPGYF